MNVEQNASTPKYNQSSTDSTAPRMDREDQKGAVYENYSSAFIVNRMYTKENPDPLMVMANGTIFEGNLLSPAQFNDLKQDTIEKELNKLLETMIKEVTSKSTIL